MLYGLTPPEIQHTRPKHNLELLNTLPLGTIRFTATHYRTAEGGKSIVEMDFLAQIIALENFAFAADNPRPVPCPPEQ
jgi:hypothetical protein